MTSEGYRKGSRGAFGNGWLGSSLLHLPKEVKCQESLPNGCLRGHPSLQSTVHEALSENAVFVRVDGLVISQYVEKSLRVTFGEVGTNKDRFVQRQTTLTLRAGET